MGANIDVLMLYAYETRKCEGFRGVIIKSICTGVLAHRRIG